MSLLPMAVFGLEVPAGDVAIPARSEIPSAFSITMAAIDPTAEAEGEEGAPKRATLKIIRQPLIFDDSEDDEEDDDFDPDEMERMLAEESSDDDESEDDAAGGPSDPTKTKAARKAAAQEAIKKLLEQDDMDVDAAKPNGIKSKKALGKMPASDEEVDDMSDSDDDDMEGGEIEEFVICTLDADKNYQQPLNLTIGSDERVWFKVSGTHTIYLTGNYVEPTHSHDEDSDEDGEGMYDEDEYDLSPDEDELELDDEDELDELDGMEDPRITEIDEEEAAPALIEAKADKKAEKKGKNKRAAEDDSVLSLDAMITDSKAEPTTNGAATNGDAKLSKKQLKKLKKNDGTATAAGAEEVPSSNKSDKKVQFAKELEQGPTPTKGAEKGKASIGVKTVQGVTCDDKKIGTGPAAKSGDRVGMRYIGKLAKDNKIFDSNKKGKPFSFKLGAGEVIKGWDIGVAGMSVGGERRLTIPANLAYGSRGAPPDIPGNSTLIFDLKVMEINKGK